MKREEGGEKECEMFQVMTFDQVMIIILPCAKNCKMTRGDFQIDCNEKW